MSLETKPPISLPINKDTKIQPTPLSKEQQESLDISKSLKRNTLLVTSIEERIRLINELKTIDTGVVAGIGDWIGDKTGAYETGKEIYTRSIHDATKSAKELHAKILKEYEWKNLPESEKIKITGLIARLEKASGAKLAEVSWGKAVFQTMEINPNIESNVLTRGVRGALGVAEGIFDGTIGMITGVLDLSKFVYKYTESAFGKNKEYRKQMDTQISQIYTFVKKEGFTGMGPKVYEAIGAECDRIATLPMDEQADAIGKFAGNVIAMLLVIKWGMALGQKVAGLTGKIAQAERISVKLAEKGFESSARAARVSAIGREVQLARNTLWVADKFLNGPAESLIGSALAMSLGKTLSILKIGGVTLVEKIASIHGTLKEMNEALKNEKDAVIRENIQRAKKQLEKEAQKLKVEARSGATEEIVEKNAQLSEKERIIEAERLLKEKGLLDPNTQLSQEQMKLILAGHVAANDIPVFEQNFSSIRKKAQATYVQGEKDPSKILSKEQKRVLMDYGVMGDMPSHDILKHLNFARRDGIQRIENFKIGEVIYSWEIHPTNIVSSKLHGKNGVITSSDGMVWILWPGSPWNMPFDDSFTTRFEPVLFAIKDGKITLQNGEVKVVKDFKILEEWVPSRVPTRETYKSLFKESSDGVKKLQIAETFFKTLLAPDTKVVAEDVIFLVQILEDSSIRWHFARTLAQDFEKLPKDIQWFLFTYKPENFIFALPVEKFPLGYISKIWDFSFEAQNLIVWIAQITQNMSEAYLQTITALASSKYPVIREEMARWFYLEGLTNNFTKKPLNLPANFHKELETVFMNDSDVTIREMAMKNGKQESGWKSVAELISSILKSQPQYERILKRSGKDIAPYLQLLHWDEKLLKRYVLLIADPFVTEKNFMERLKILEEKLLGKDDFYVQSYLEWPYYPDFYSERELWSLYRQFPEKFEAAFDIFVSGGHQKTSEYMIEAEKFIQLHDQYGITLYEWDAITSWVGTSWWGSNSQHGPRNFFSMSARVLLDSAIEKLPTYTGKAYRWMSFKTEQDMQRFLQGFHNGGSEDIHNFISDEAYAKKFARNTRHGVLLEIESRNGHILTDELSSIEEHVWFERWTNFSITHIDRSSQPIRVRLASK